VFALCVDSDNGVPCTPPFDYASHRQEPKDHRKRWGYTHKEYTSRQGAQEVCHLTNHLNLPSPRLNASWTQLGPERPMAGLGRELTGGIPPPAFVLADHSLRTRYGVDEYRGSDPPNGGATKLALPVSCHTTIAGPHPKAVGEASMPYSVA